MVAVRASASLLGGKAGIAAITGVGALIVALATGLGLQTWRLGHAQAEAGATGERLIFCTAQRQELADQVKHQNERIQALVDAAAARDTADDERARTVLQAVPQRRAQSYRLPPGHEEMNRWFGALW